MKSPFAWVRARWQALYNFFYVDEPRTEESFEAISARLTSPQGRATFWDELAVHLVDLRNHVLRGLLALILTTALSAIFAGPLMNALAEPVGGIANLQVIEPTESVGVFMRVALLAGVVFAMPWLVTEVFLFVAPGLLARERRALVVYIPIASLLFLSGVMFAYAVMLPAAVPFLRDFMGFQTAWRPSAYFDLVTGLMFWVGVAFQMPLVIYIAAALGWVRARQLLAYWRYAVVVIAIIAAMITPTTDPVNMGLVMLPMIGLYFISIGGAWLAERRRASRRPA